MNLSTVASVAMAALVGIILAMPEPPASTTALTDELEQWRKKGSMVEVYGYQVFTMKVECTTNQANAPTFVLIHGFPTSSFDYHLALPRLAEVGHVILYDHLGFGLSEKPVNFSYSMVDHADISLELWRKLEIHPAHLISHDMGDSVLAEILARRERGLLPGWFDDFFQSVTFTNGGMQYELANLRLSQHLLMTPRVGPAFANLIRWLGIDGWTQRQQLGTLWGSTDSLERDQAEIGNIIALNKYGNGVARMPTQISYIYDRYRFEKHRWVPALQRIRIPVRLVWGDSDAVAPMAIAERVLALVPQADLVVLRGVGHFLMIEAPSQWAAAVTRPWDAAPLRQS